ncbi:hypothetical protein BKE30_11120 [Alkanindiges hydrocarboniclasticus]|uniref:Lipoprotein n=1 Tax=Alkanindiges hydrocarboniclasticus TaxID=1907941 RepID=A0A1S8CS41_9GAMM|nr:hypothetical protein [Alkanindiges hydrocarboniclasticus]ONG38713.1 hypothetical protein BKE30_11120 [Alkanindiges hydrocarboniclasticus]
MISKQILGQAVLLGTMAMVLMGCDKKQEPIKATDAPAVQQAHSDSDDAHKSENDLYIERLNKDVKVENPDALLDEVNQEAKTTQ